MLAKRANRKAALGSKIEGKLFVFLFLAVATTLTGTARAQNCLTSDEMDAPTRQALELAAQRYFALAASGDVAALKRSSTAGVAEAFAATAAAVQASQANLATTKPALHSVFALTVEDQAPGPITAQRKEFLCGAFGKAGQTASSAVFVLDNLSAGRYGVAILDATRSGGGTADATKNEPYVVSFVLQQVAGEWRLAGFYARPAQSAGHGSEWFTERAQAFVGKSQKHNAWFYFQEARNLATTVPFMSTRETDALYDEAQKIGRAHV